MSRRGSKRRKERRQPKRNLRKKKRLRKKRSVTKKPALKAPPPTPAPSPKTASNIVWENIVLHYLYKLKNAWKSTPNQNNTNQTQRNDLESVPTNKNISKSRYTKVESRATTPSKCPPKEKSTKPPRQTKSQNSNLSIGQSSYSNAKRKAITIVRNAIDYGQSKGIISKNGKFFWLKDDMQIIPKLDADCTCIHCNVCKNKIPLKKSEVDKIKKKSGRSSTTGPSFTSKQAAFRFKDYKSKSKYPDIYQKNKKRAHFEDDSDEDFSYSKSDY